jgi:hypothetical protein
LAGWRYCRNQDPAAFDEAIRDDYQDYIQKLPPGERYFVQGGETSFFEDGTGKHAVKIEIPLNGTWHDHILIYDRGNRRAKVFKYLDGRYAS